MNRLDWAVKALSLIADEGAAVLVTQCLVEGSAPREAGTKMLVSGQAIIGTIGGGNLEMQIIRQARQLLSRSDIPHLLQDYPLGPLLRQCCGGHVRILLERLTSDDTDWLTNISDHGRSPRQFVLETKLIGKSPRKSAHPATEWQQIESCAFIGSDQTISVTKQMKREACVSFIERVPALPPTIMLYGAGHVGEAIAHVLSISDFPNRWFDSRPEYQVPKGNLSVEALENVETIIADAPSSAIHLIMTHDHDLDYALTRNILQRGDFLFCGLIGSKTKRTRFIRRLRDDGIADASISRLTSPIGLSDISGKAPAIIAVSVAAQLFQIRQDETRYTANTQVLSIMEDLHERD